MALVVKSKPPADDSAPIQPKILWIIERLLRRRWVKIAGIVLALVLLSATFFYQRYVRPTLTASKYHISAVGGPSGPIVEIDPARSLVVLRGSQTRVPDLVITVDRLLVPVNVFELADVPDDWVSFPLASFDDLVDELAPSRVAEALQRRPKQCASPSPDAQRIVTLLVEQDFGTDSDEARYTMCGEAIGGGSFADGRNIRVERDRVHPADITDPDELRTVEVETMSDGDALTADVQNMLGPRV